jgi:hypothetical protein
MIRSVTAKAAWVGRTASMVFGLALVMALVVGAASTAWSATGGNFILGKGNAADTVTRLAGAAGVDGPMLKHINKNADPNDTALDLRVQAGEAPMRVNSDTKVADLNADKVDGKDSTEFLASECRPGFTAFSEGGGRLCVSEMMPPTTFYLQGGALLTCRDIGARVGNSNDAMLTFTDPTFNYFGDMPEGWLADHIGDDIWGTWNTLVPRADGNFDGTPRNGDSGAPLPYRCVY